MSMSFSNRLAALASLCLCATAVPADDLDFLEYETPAASTDKAQAAKAESVAISLPAEAIPAEPPARRGRVIEEIVVTAQKTEQTLQEVPVAVSVVSGDTLRDAGIFGAEGLENLVPNLELDTDAQSPTIGIRGFSTDSYNVGLEPSVGIIVDDIPLGRSEFIPDGLFDIGRVEVLRGPQGTLFGKNTIAGVLIFGTGCPAPEVEASAIASAGEYGGKRIEAMLNSPLGEASSARAAFVSWHEGGEVDNSFLKRRELTSDQLAGRLKFSIDVNDRLQLKLGAQLSDTDTDYSGWQLYDMDPDALEYARSKDPETEDDPYNARNSFNLPGHVRRDTHLLSAIADYALSEDLNLTVIAGHAALFNDIAMDFDVSAADLVNVTVPFDFSQKSLELRFSGQASPWGADLEFVGGLFAFESELDIHVDVAMGEDIADFAATPAGMEAIGAPGASPAGLLLNSLSLPPSQLDDGVHQTFLQQARSLAAFGQLTWYLNAQLSAILGMRLGTETKDALLSVHSRGPGITAAILEADEFDQPLSREEDEFSPKLGLRYEFSEDLASYLSWTRGYKGGGFNAISFQNENLSFEPERGDNYELGSKTRWLEGSLALNATVYHTRVSNMQVVNFNGISFDVFNAAEAVLEGVEADLTWLTPWPWLSLNAAFALGRAEYLRYPDAPAAANGDNNQCDAAGDCSQDLSGKTLPKAPTMTLSLSPSVSLPLRSGLGLIFALDLSHRGEQYLELDLDPHAYQRAHQLLGARLSLGATDETWGLTLRGDNLTNTQALNFVADHNLYANSYFANQATERRFSLSFSARW